MQRRLVISMALVLLATVARAAKPLPTGTPDLTISAYAVTSPAVVHCGQQTITFNITETNLGNAPSGPYVTGHSVNGSPLCGFNRPSLPPGASATFTDVCPMWNGPCCNPGSWTLPFFGTVDATGVVAESNESNNQGPTVIQPAVCP
jgi:subtilase family serine protease